MDSCKNITVSGSGKFIGIVDCITDKGSGAIITGTERTQITTNKSRLDTLIDSGETLDAISELKAAWEGADEDLKTLVVLKADKGKISEHLIPTDDNLMWD